MPRGAVVRVLCCLRGRRRPVRVIPAGSRRGGVVCLRSRSSTMMRRVRIVLSRTRRARWRRRWVLWVVEDGVCSVLFMLLSLMHSLDLVSGMYFACTVVHTYACFVWFVAHGGLHRTKVFGSPSCKKQGSTGGGRKRSLAGAERYTCTRQYVGHVSRLLLELKKRKSLYT